MSVCVMCASVCVCVVAAAAARERRRGLFYDLGFTAVGSPPFLRLSFVCQCVVIMCGVEVDWLTHGPRATGHGGLFVWVNHDAMLHGTVGSVLARAIA
jgi:hypothetical protein